MKAAIRKRVQELMDLTDSEVRKVWDNVRMSEEKARLIRLIIRAEFKEAK
jgi:hypothetical protein